MSGALYAMDLTGDPRAWVAASVFGVLAVALVWWLLGRRRIRPMARPGVIVLPTAGVAARVLTHFGPTGGYVALGNLVFWAVADGRTDGLTPGQRCVVTAADQADGAPTARVAPPAAIDIAAKGASQ